MMHEMKTPQPRHAMREDVPHVKRVIQQNDGERDFQGVRQRQLFEQSKFAPFDERGEPSDDRSFGELQRDGGHSGHGEVARIAHPFRFDRTPPQRATPLQPQQRAERDDDKRHTDPGGNFSHLLSFVPIYPSIKE